MNRAERRRQEVLTKKKQVKINIDPNTLDEIKCKCGNDTFIQGFKMKKISAIMSPNGQAGYVNMPAALCAKCHEALAAKP